MRHPLFCPYGPFAAADGRLVSVAVLSPEHWRAFCADVLERPDLLADPRYATNEERVAVRAELEPVLEDAFRLRPAAEWERRLEAASIPFGSVNDVADVLAHPQLAHNGLVTEVDSPVGRIPTIGAPFLVDGQRPEVGAVPGLGEHTDDPS
jgi:crotonobetainyl-CoA:carnitine CoA-transferase CaiB-like acyl-CoA transferase